MTRTVAATTWSRTPTEERAYSFEYSRIPDGVLEVQDLRVGIVNRLPRDQRPPGSWEVADNARIKGNRVERRPGLGVYHSGSADPFPLLVNPGYFMAHLPFRLTGTTSWLIKVAENVAWLLTSRGGDWIEMSGDIPTEFTRLSYTQYPANKLFIALRSQKVTEVNVAERTFEEIDEAPYANFVTSFADRIVAANLAKSSDGYSGTLVAWSAWKNPYVWNPLEDISAGQEDLLSSPSDEGDDITGIFGFGNLMVMLREQSIWHCTRQPIGYAPFRFEPAIIGLGCDMPHTAVRVPGGIIFADQQSEGVYLYRPGAGPQELSIQLDPSIFSDIIYPKLTKAAYDHRNKQYHLGLATDADKRWLGPLWVLNMKDGLSWTRDTFEANPSQFVTSLDAVADVGTAEMIDEITDMINTVSDTIDSFKTTEIQRPIVVVNHPQNPESLYYEEEYNWDRLNGNQEFNLVLEAQDLGSVARRRSLKELGLVIEVKDTAESDGDLVIESNVDDQGWEERENRTHSNLIANYASHDDNGVTRYRTKAGFKRNVNGDRIKWRLTTSIQGFRLYEWWVKLLEKSKKSQEGPPMP